MIPHGTFTKYSNDNCRCGGCTQAWADYINDLKYQRATRANPAIPHGYGGYTNWRCRCEVCTTANRDHTRAYRRRKRAEAAHGAA